MYYLVLAIGLLLSIGNRKGIITKIYAILLACLAVFRFGCGSDYFSYNYIFTRLGSTIAAEFASTTNQYEIGFRLIGAFCKQFNIPYQGFLAIFAIVGIYYLYKIAVRYSENPTLSLTVYYACYYMFWTFSSIRQGLVIAVGVYYLLRAIKDNKIITFVIVTILLSFIHRSALFLLVFYIVSLINLDRKKLIILSVASVLFAIIPWGMIVSQFPGNSVITRKILQYVHTTDYALQNILDFQTIGRVGFLGVALVFYHQYCDGDKDNERIMRVYIWGFIFYFVLKFSELTAARLMVYAKVLDIVILVNIFYNLKLKNHKYYYITFLAFLLLAYLAKDLRTMELHSGLVDSNTLYTPYVNIFNKESFEFINKYFTP